MKSKKPQDRKKSRRKPVARKPVARMSVARKPAPRKRTARGKIAGGARISPDFVPLNVAPPPAARGLGPESAGQSGDTTGLSRSRGVEYESVEELIEEGQAFEAGVLAGVENAPDADTAEVTTREVTVDDVPEEYFEPVERR